MNTSIDFSEGYLKCLEELSTYMKEVKYGGAPATPKEITEHFILPNIEKHHKNIGDVLDDMYKDFHKNHNH